MPLFSHGRLRLGGSTFLVIHSSMIARNFSCHCIHEWSVLSEMIEFHFLHYCYVMFWTYTSCTCSLSLAMVVSWWMACFVVPQILHLPEAETLLGVGLSVAVTDLSCLGSPLPRVGLSLHLYLLACLPWNLGWAFCKLRWPCCVLSRGGRPPRWRLVCWATLDQVLAWAPAVISTALPFSISGLDLVVDNNSHLSSSIWTARAWTVPRSSSMALAWVLLQQWGQ